MALDIRTANASDLPVILEITNDAIANTTAVWSVAPATSESRGAWLRERQSRGFPVFVAVDQANVIGFASFGDFRPWDGYAHTVEHSVYVHRSARRKGVGSALLSSLIGGARAMGKHAMVGGVEAENIPSLRLHARLGFSPAGRLPQVGRKFNRWLDLIFVVRVLDDSGGVK